MIVRMKKVTLLCLAHDRAAGGARLQDLPDKAPEDTREEEHPSAPALAVRRRV